MKKITLALAFSFISFIAHSVETYLTMENDTFLVKQDNDYTHGTEFKVVDGRLHYLIQQNMYAPSDLKKHDHIKGDRPYCGLLLGGVGYEFFSDPNSNWDHYGELNFGMVGPLAGCKATQTFIHKMLGCKKPEGWDNQLHNEFVVNAQWWTKYNYFVTDWFAVVPRVGIAAGTLQDMIEAGFDLRIGYNMRKTPGNSIMFSAPSVNNLNWKDKLSVYVFAGVDERYYLYNHILEGSLFGHKDDHLDVSIHSFVPEARTGIVLKYDRFFLSYRAVFRGDEFKHQKHHPDYGSICIGWEW